MKKLFFLFIGILLLNSCQYTMTEEIKCAKILGKERISKYVDGQDQSYYLIYTDKGEFTIEDDLLRGNFSSSHWYGKFQEGKTYTFKVGGYRSGFLSSYQNVYTEPVLCIDN